MEKLDPYIVRIKDLDIEDVFSWLGDRQEYAKVDRNWKKANKETIIIPLTGKHVKRNKVIYFKDIPKGSFFIRIEENNSNIFLQNILFKKENRIVVDPLCRIEIRPKYNIREYNKCIVLHDFNVSFNIKNGKELPNISRLEYLRRNKEI